MTTDTPPLAPLQILLLGTPSLLLAMGVAAWLGLRGPGWGWYCERPVMMAC